MWAKSKLGYNVDYVKNVKVIPHLCKLQAANNLYIQKIVIKIFNANKLEILVEVKVRVYQCRDRHAILYPN
jgi:hypothetical protein